MKTTTLGKMSFPLLTAVFLLSLGCTKNDLQNTENTLPKSALKAATAQVQSVSLTEGFEVGSSSPKTAYDVSPTGSASGDDVTLSGKTWNL